MNLKDKDDFDALIEIVEALAKTMKNVVADRRRGLEEEATSIHNRAQKLRNERLGDDDHEIKNPAEAGSKEEPKW